MHSLKDKTIVLTGAAGGIGQSVAELLNTMGATLVLTDINSDKLEQLNHGFNDKHYTVAADLASAEGRSTLVECCNDMLSPPQMLINIAGINQVLNHGTGLRGELNGGKQADQRFFVFRSRILL